MAKTADNTTRIRLDMATLEQRSLLYPEELREPFIWLGNYVRTECSREIDLLTDKAKKLGIHFDKTTWSKIIRGKWNRDANDNILETPVVALTKLLKAIDTLCKDARVKEQGGKIAFVPTSTTRQIFHYIDKKRAPDRVCKFGVVIGETGNQKTATFKEYCRQNNHGACVWVDSPATPSMNQFITDLGVCYGISVQASWTKKQAAIRMAVNDRKTIIIENVQRLYREKDEGNQTIFNYLQKLQEDTGCTIIISFTPVFEAKFTAGKAKGFFEQFEGRAGGSNTFLRLEEYAPEEDVLEIIKAFGLREAEKHLDYCVEISRAPGRIRILFETLQDAKIMAEAKSQPLTIAHIKAEWED